MTAHVLVIGLDAAEPTLIEAWAGQGSLPHIRRLMDRAIRFDMANSLRTLPGAIWPELETGIGCGRVPHYYHPAQLHTGEAERRPIAPGEVDPETYYWVRAGRAGLKIAALDMPQTVLAEGIDGIQLTEWGLHDRNFEIASAPAAFLANVRQLYGDHPVLSCDAHGRTQDGYRALYEKLRVGAALKSQLLEETLRSESWDLFTTCFGETHCVGHQFWHFQDDRHPWHDPAAVPEFRAAMRAVYQDVDAGVGRLVAAAGPDADIVLVASHGMGAYTGGPNLLNELLARMGLSGTARDSGVGQFVRHLQRHQGRAAHLVRGALRPLLGRALLRRAQSEFGALHAPLTSPDVRATALPNNRCGAIRFNLKGREPFGTVAPGNEAGALRADITEALLALRDPSGDVPIVENVVTAEDAFGPDRHADVPDLMIVFRDDLGTLDACVSPKFGRIDAPVYKRNLPRSGDHTTQSRCWIAGRGIGGGAGQGDVLDLAPTVLTRLGVTLHAALEGRPLIA